MPLWNLGAIPDIQNALPPAVLLVQFLTQTIKHCNNSSFDIKPLKVAGFDLCLRFSELPDLKMGRRPDILTEVSRIFPQSLHVNAETLSQITVRTPLSHYFQLIIYEIVISIDDNLN
jgi:hypothetical protein